MGAVSIADVACALFIVFSIVFAYMHGFENGKRSCKQDDNVVEARHNAYNLGYNCGYVDGINVERKNVNGRTSKRVD